MAPRWGWLAAAAAAGLAYLGKDGIVSGVSGAIDASKEGLFAAALPDEIGQWSSEILAAARNYGISPWVIAGVMYRESHGGNALRPPGPGGTGDFGQRRAGRQYANGYVVPSSGMPEDGQGWGRGLMQIDWAYHYPWASQNAWYDPATNLAYAAGLLRSSQNFFTSGPGGPVYIAQEKIDGTSLVQGYGSLYGVTSRGPYNDPRPLSGDALTQAVLAAYNGGDGHVLAAIAAGLPASAPTAHNDYADWILQRVVAWASAIT